MIIRLTAGLEGLRRDLRNPSQKFQIGEFTIEPAENAEVSDWFSSTFPQSNLMYVAKAVIHTGSDNRINPPVVHQSLDALITCFRLFKRGPISISFGTAETKSSENASYVRSYTFGWPISISESGGSFGLHNSEIPLLEKLSQKIIPLISQDHNSSLSDPAFSFFNRGVVDLSRNDYPLAISDYVSCLESLFNVSSELRHRLSEVVAWVTERDPAKRILRYTQVLELYDLESKIIHGSKNPKSEKETVEFVITADFLARKSLLLYLAYCNVRKGRTDILEDIKKLIFGAKTDFPEEAYEFMKPEYGQY